MVILTRLKELYAKIENKKRIQMFRGYLINRLYLRRINLKRPLSRGSRFKIYFHLECRRNRGSCQNFHGIPFFKDHVLINPGHYVILPSHTHVNNQKI